MPKRSLTTLSVSKPANSAELGRAGTKLIAGTMSATVSSTQEMMSRECCLTGDGDFENSHRAEREEPLCGLVLSTASSAAYCSGYVQLFIEFVHHGRSERSTLQMHWCLKLQILGFLALAC